MKSVARYRIRHSTTYTYDQPVKVCHNIVMLTPRCDGPVFDAKYRVQVHPQPNVVRKRLDYFGNIVETFSLSERPHKMLQVTASGRVDVGYTPRAANRPSPNWESVRDAIATQSDANWFHACQYLFDSGRIRRSDAFKAYALESFQPRRPVVEAAVDLTQRIYREFKYDGNATDVHTPTKKAFEIRKGVCQDFAHIQIACLRSIGMPARYVSGYLRTVTASDQVRLVGADQSHAWISVYCGDATGWLDLDPTNNKPSDTDHIPIAWGRDYNDVIPVRGVFLGGGHHSVTVSVDVEPILENVK